MFQASGRSSWPIMTISDPARPRWWTPGAFRSTAGQESGNVTFISPENVLEEGRLKPRDGLKDTFARLNTSRTTVVYSDDICGASVVRFALLRDSTARFMLGKTGRCERDRWFRGTIACGREVQLNLSFCNHRIFTWLRLSRFINKYNYK